MGSEPGEPQEAWRAREAQDGLSALLTKDLLAVKDLKATVHAGCQQQVLVERVPLESPHAALHGHVHQGLPHVPGVPE